MSAEQNQRDAFAVVTLVNAEQDMEAADIINAQTDSETAGMALVMAHMLVEAYGIIAEASPTHSLEEIIQSLAAIHTP